ncbi:MAG TPA: ATP-binding cassette domain-containing protein [Acidimicrobiia bacterium]|jgi:putative ABC transport system ATP-binding protein
MPGLEIRDLVVEYSSGGYAVRPIDGLSVTTEAGELVLLLGPSGCGKTTLLSCLGGILTPTSGTITFGETTVTGLDGARLTDYRRHTVGIVFQAFNLVPSLTALENVEVPLRAAKVPKAQRRARATELLEQVGLSERMKHRPGDMSGGQQQRVAIARALALDPPLLLADEPTAHLDYIAVEEILRLLRDLASGERVVVISTHDQRMLPLADRVVELVPQFGRVEVAEPEVVDLAAGEELFAQGSFGELIYMLEAGEVEILRRLENGSWESRVTVTPGRYFGEIGPLFGMPRSATARAKTAAKVTGYSVRDFRQRIGPQGMGELLSHAGDT